MKELIKEVLTNEEAREEQALEKLALNNAEDAIPWR